MNYLFLMCIYSIYKCRAIYRSSNMHFETYEYLFKACCVRFVWFLHHVCVCLFVWETLLFSLQPSGIHVPLQHEQKIFTIKISKWVISGCSRAARFTFIASTCRVSLLRWSNLRRQRIFPLVSNVATVHVCVCVCTSRQSARVLCTYLYAHP